MSPSTTLIETDRLLLRPLTLDDLDPLYALYSDREIRRFFPDGVDGTLTYAETKAELDWIIDQHYGKHGFGTWATLYKDTGAFIGRCGLIPWTLDGRFDVEVAYLLDKAYWGQGLATEAAQAIVEYAFGPLNLTRLICLVDPGNAASRRVAQKIGMRFEKVMVEADGTPYLFLSMSKLH